MEQYKVFEIEFMIGLKTATWNKWQNKSKRLVLAKDLDSIVNDWPKYLLELVPWEEGHGSGHYSTDSIFGDMFKFTSIKELHENVLVYEKRKKV